MTDKRRRDKRRYPWGRLGPDDEGQLAVMIFAVAEPERVVIEFPGPTRWIGLTPEQARTMAAKLLTQAVLAEGTRRTLPQTEERAAEVFKAIPDPGEGRCNMMISDRPGLEGGVRVKFSKAASHIDLGPLELANFVAALRLKLEEHSDK